MMVEPTDPDALSQCMVELYFNESLCHDMSQRSLRQAKKFTWQECARQTVKAYTEALDLPSS
jgi:glycosyltransferase involved in cell wall biosynthesis